MNKIPYHWFSSFIATPANLQILKHGRHHRIIDMSKDFRRVEGVNENNWWVNHPNQNVQEEPSTPAGHRHPSHYTIWAKQSLMIFRQHRYSNSGCEIPGSHVKRLTRFSYRWPGCIRWNFCFTAHSWNTPYMLNSFHMFDLTTGLSQYTGFD